MSVGLFGTFGFKEAGLYDQYMKENPNITIKEDVIEHGPDYLKALQTHLAAGSGLDDVQAFEIGFVGTFLNNNADKFVNFAALPEGPQLKSTFYDWKWNGATTPDGKATIGLGTDSGPEAMCYRSDLLKAAGLPTDPATLGQMWSTWDGLISFGKQYKASTTKPAGSAFLDSAASIFSAEVYQGTHAYDDDQGKPIPATSDGILAAWKNASAAAQAGLTAKLLQFTPTWNSGFANNAFAAIACPSWMLGYITSQAGDAGKGKWNVTSLPGGASNWGGSWLNVPKGGPHEAEAIKLAEWLTAPAQQVTMWTKRSAFPSSSTAGKDPAIAAAVSDYFSNAPIGQIYNTVAQKMKLTPPGPFDSAMTSAFETALNTIETNGKTPDEAFAKAQADIKQAIGS
ncbi:MAG TPA: extracellular solute-binding protein [Acidothermaceae bacterium]